MSVRERWGRAPDPVKEAAADVPVEPESLAYDAGIKAAAFVIADPVMRTAGRLLAGAALGGGAGAITESPDHKIRGAILGAIGGAVGAHAVRKVLSRSGHLVRGMQKIRTGGHIPKPQVDMLDDLVRRFQVGEKLTATEAGMLADTFAPALAADAALAGGTSYAVGHMLSTADRRWGPGLSSRSRANRPERMEFERYASSSIPHNLLLRTVAMEDTREVEKMANNGMLLVRAIGHLGDASGGALTGAIFSPKGHRGRGAALGAVGGLALGGAARGLINMTTGGAARRGALATVESITRKKGAQEAAAFVERVVANKATPEDIALLQKHTFPRAMLQGVGEGLPVFGAGVLAGRHVRRGMSGGLTDVPQVEPLDA